MSETTDDVAYFDTGVWIALLLGKKDPHYEFAYECITRLQERKHRAFVSDLVLLEAIDALRRIIPRYAKHSHFNRLAIEEDIENKTRNLFSLIEILTKEGKTIYETTDASIQEIHKNALVYLLVNFGDVRERRDGSYAYIGLGHLDIQHAMIAASLKAKTFYTTDKSFVNLEKQFRPLKFVIDALQ